MGTCAARWRGIGEAQRIADTAETERDRARGEPRCLLVLADGRGGRPLPAPRGVHCCAMTPDAAVAAFPTAADVLSGETADVYFERARTILAAEGLDPVVTMEIFSRGEGVLCGAEEALAYLREIFTEANGRSGRSSSRSTTATGSPRRRSSCGSRRATPRSACTRRPSSASWLRLGWATAARRVVDAADADPGHRLRRAPRPSQRGGPDGLRKRGRRMHRRLDACGRAPGGAGARPGRCRMPWCSSSATPCAPPRPSTARSIPTCRASSWSTRSRTRRRSRCASPRRSAIGCGASGSTRRRSADA